MRKPTSTVLIVVVPSVLIFILAIWGVAMNARFIAINKIWSDYNSSAAAAYEAYSDVNRYTGYGGFIHNFKNYVLRRDSSYVANIDSDLINLFAALDRLDRLVHEQDERAALVLLRSTFMEYRNKYEIAKRMVAAGEGSAAIDKVVRVNDGPVLIAMNILFRRIDGRSDQAKADAALALTATQSLLHWGGMMLIPIIAVAWLTGYFLRRVESATLTAKRAQDQTDLILETAPDPMLAIDSEGNIRRANKMAISYFGYPNQTLLQLKIESLVPERYRSGHGFMRSIFMRSPTNRPMGQGRSLKTTLASGEERDVGISLSHFNTGEEDLFTVVLRDVTEQKKAEEGLRLASSVFENSAEGVLVTDSRGFIISVNPAFSALTGYGEFEALGQKPSLIRSDRHDEDFYKAMWKALISDGFWQGEIWNRKKNGEAYLEWLTINRIDDIEGNPVRYASIFHDITELRRKDEGIRHLAFHDALTGLPNRALLQERLQHGLERAKRDGDSLVVMFLDLDHFKAVNDNLGHDVGDMLLQDVAQRIKRRLRTSDTLARLGGDEFVVLIEEVTDLAVCCLLASEIIAVVSQPMELRGHSVQVGTSVGIAIFPADGEDSQTLMKNADLAMYAAKSGGRNTYRTFHPAMLDRVLAPSA